MSCGSARDVKQKGQTTSSGGLVLKGILRQCVCHFTMDKHQAQEELAEMSFHWVHQTSNSPPSRSHIWLFGLFRESFFPGPWLR